MWLDIDKNYLFLVRLFDARERTAKEENEENEDFRSLSLQRLTNGYSSFLDL